MVQQIPVDPAAVAAADNGDGTLDLVPDVAYQRLLMVNVVFVGEPGTTDWVLVDAGVHGTANHIARAAAARFGPEVPPRAILLTHGHFDHVGALSVLAERWNVPVYAHRLERPYLDGTASYPAADPGVGGGIMAALSPLYPRRPVHVGARLRDLPDDGGVPALPGWRWIHTPGHSVGHVSFWRDADRTLIAGDAFITVAGESAYATATQAPEIHGPPRYLTHDWQAARGSVAVLAALEPERAVTGHGRAMQGAGVRDALHALSDRFDHVAVPAHGMYVGAPRRAEDGSAYPAP